MYFKIFKVHYVDDNGQLNLVIIAHSAYPKTISPHFKTREMDPIVEFSSDDEPQDVENCFHIQMRNIAREAYPKHLSKRHTGACVSLNCSAPKWRIPCKSINLIEFLTEEIEVYAEYIRPSPAEFKIREHIMSTLSELVSTLFVDAQLHAFGSTATNTVLANGDIDLVILNKVQQQDKLPTLRKLNSHLRRHKDFTRVHLIDKAKVPIVKFVHALSGIYIDISCDQQNGIKAAEMMNTMLEKRPFHPLLYVLKAFLREHQLNEVRTGGFGSFSLSIMIAGFLNSHPITSDPKCDLKANFGVILLEFLETFGKNMNPTKCGVSLKGFVSNNEKGFLTRDPDAINNNLTGGSYAAYTVRSAMYLAFCKLTDAIYLHTSQIRWFYDKLTQENPERRNYDQIFVQDNEPHPKLQLPKTLLGYILDLGYDLDKHHRTMLRVHSGIEKSGVANTSFENPLEVIQTPVEDEEEPYFVPFKREHSDEIIKIEDDSLLNDMEEPLAPSKKRQREEEEGEYEVQIVHKEAASEDGEVVLISENPIKKRRLENW